MAEEWKQHVVQAVERGDTARLHMLLQSTDRISLNFENSIRSFSPLLKAVYSNKCDIVEQLLRAGAGVNFWGPSGNTPLGIAASNGYTTLCKILLRYGAKMNLKNKRGVTPLCLAAMKGESEVVALLLENEAQLFNSSKTSDNFEALHNSPLGMCIQLKHNQEFTKYVDKINVGLPLAALFHFSVHYGTEYCCILLLKQGYYPTLGSEKGFILDISCFHLAAMNYHSSLMRLLVAINPHFLQEKWLINQHFPICYKERLHGDFFHWLFEIRKQPPDLTQLCKSRILSQLDFYYLREGKIDKLPLPNSLREFLKSMQ